VRWLRPDLVVRSVHDVDHNALYRRGIRALIYDLENTLCRWREWELDERTHALLQDLRDRGMQIAILTNAWVPPEHRLVRELGELGIPVVVSARKPLRSGFRRALARLGVDPGQAAMIGDQILTDVLGGKMSGLHTTLVDPLGPEESRLTKVNRWVERRLGRRMNRNP